MSKKSNDHNKNNFDKNKNFGKQDEKRIEQLINLVDKHTRTERHLEQHSDIATPEAIAHSKEVQEEREQEIDNLKNVIAYGKHVNVDDSANLQRNYEFTNSYINANENRMDTETLGRTKEKQENRAEHMNNILK
jgi:hypothetical protein